MDSADCNADDYSKFLSYTDSKDWKEKDIYESIRNRFVTGDWSKAAQRNQLGLANTGDDDDSVYGDFEDLETGEKYESHQKGESKNGATKQADELANEERRLKKLALRAKFDAQYPFCAECSTIISFFSYSVMIFRGDPSLFISHSQCLCCRE